MLKLFFYCIIYQKGYNIRSITFWNGSSYTAMYLLYIKSFYIGREKQNFSVQTFILMKCPSNCVELGAQFSNSWIFEVAFSAFCSRHFWCWNGCFLVITTLSGSGWKESLGVSLLNFCWKTHCLLNSEIDYCEHEKQVFKISWKKQGFWVL